MYNVYKAPAMSPRPLSRVGPQGPPSSESLGTLLGHHPPPAHLRHALCGHKCPWCVWHSVLQMWAHLAHEGPGCLSVLRPRPLTLQRASRGVGP